MTRTALSCAFLLTTAACDAPETVTEQPTAGSEMLERLTRSADGGQVHLVRLVQRGDQYAFDPAEVVIRPGEVVRFVMTGSQPESIAFDPAAAPQQIAQYIRENSLDRGVLLTDPGQAYDVSFSEAPPGTYPFQSIPHAERGMRGTVTVGPAS